MKKLRRIIALLAVLSVSTIFTGCGDDDDGGGGGGGGQQQNTGGNTGTRVNAPESLAGQTYFGRTSAGTHTITFTSGNTFTLQRAGASAPESGTFTATRNNDIWTVQLAPTSGGGAQESQLYLSFSASNSGSFTLTQAGQPVISGTFDQGGSSGSTAGSTSGTTAGSTGTTQGGTTQGGTTQGGTTQGGTTQGGTTQGGTTQGGTTQGGTTQGGTTEGGTTQGGTTQGGTTQGGTTQGGTTQGGTTQGGTTQGGTTGTIPTGNAPVEVAAGTTVNIANTGGAFAGAAYRVTLSGGATGTFSVDQGATGNGTYTYTRTGANAATLRLDYQQPVQGEWDRLDMTFTTRNSGSFTGAQNVDGGGGVFTERTDYAGTFTNFTPNNNPQ